MNQITSKAYSCLAIPNGDNLIFSKAPLPVTLSYGLAFGGGTVYPEPSDVRSDPH
jgi:hypothetical protein